MLPRWRGFNLFQDFNSECWHVLFNILQPHREPRVGAFESSKLKQQLKWSMPRNHSMCMQAAVPSCTSVLIMIAGSASSNKPGQCHSGFPLCTWANHFTRKHATRAGSPQTRTIPAVPLKYIFEWCILLAAIVTVLILQAQSKSHTHTLAISARQLQV